MKLSGPLLVAMLSGVLLVGACSKKDEGPLDRAAEKAKDALDARDHEAIKDAAEDAKAAATEMKDAVKDAAEGAATEVKDAAAEVKDAVKSE